MNSFLLLLKNENYRKFYLAQTISSFGSRIYAIALTIYVYQLTKSAIGVATMLMLTAIPAFTLGPVFGVIIDKYNKRKLLIILNILSGIFTLLILLTDNFFYIYVVIFVTSLVGQVSGSTEKTVYTSVLPSKDFLVGSSIISVTKKVLHIFAPAIGALLITKMGFKAVIIINGVSFFIASGFFYLLRLNDEKQVLSKAKQSIGFWKSIREAFLYLKHSRSLAVLLVIVVLASYTAATSNTVMVVLVHDTLDLSSKHFGAISSFLALGMLFGASILPLLNKKFSLEKIFGFSIVLLTLSFLGTGLSNSFITISLSRFMAGFSNVMFSIISVTLLQQNIQKAYMGRVFSLLNSFENLFSIVGLSLAGLLAGFYSTRFVMLSSCGVMFFCFVLWFLKPFDNEKFQSTNQQDTA